MKHVLTVLFIFLTGCMANPVKVNVANITKSEQIAVTDLRPATEKESEILGLMIFSGADGISRKGDQLTDPSPIRLLQHRLYESVGRHETNPMNLSVYHFVVYHNAQAIRRRGLLYGGGLVGALIASYTSTRPSVLSVSNVNRREFEDLNPEEYKRAYFGSEDGFNSAAVYVAYLDAEFEGNRYFVKTVTPAESDETTNNPAPFAVESVIRAFIKKISTAKGLDNRGKDLADKKSNSINTGTAIMPSVQPDQTVTATTTDNTAKSLTTQNASVAAKPTGYDANVPVLGTPRIPGADNSFANISDVAAVPYLNDEGREAYREYLKKLAPKAFAILPTGGAFAIWGKNQDQNLPNNAAERVLILCERAAKEPCLLYAVNSVVVWSPKAPDRKQ